MYTLKRRPKIIKTIKLGKEKIKIEVNPEAIGERFAAANGVIVAAQEHYKNNPDDLNLEKLGNAVITMFRVIFGDCTEKILEFYEGSYAEMLEYVYPFIMNEIFPAIKKYGEKKVR